MTYNYILILTCSNPKDSDKFDRHLQMNNWEAAIATYKALWLGAYEDLIDSYTITLTYNNGEPIYTFEKG